LLSSVAGPYACSAIADLARLAIGAVGVDGAAVRREGEARRTRVERAGARVAALGEVAGDSDGGAPVVPGGLRVVGGVGDGERERDGGAGAEALVGDRQRGHDHLAGLRRVLVGDDGAHGVVVVVDLDAQLLRRREAERGDEGGGDGAVLVDEAA
jgi:hypothetical protein